MGLGSPGSQLGEEKENTVTNPAGDCHRFGQAGMAPAKSRCAAPSGQTVATCRGLYTRRVRFKQSFPYAFSPCVILSTSPLEQNRILGDTDLGNSEVAEAAPPTSDGDPPAWCPGRTRSQGDWTSMKPNRSVLVQVEFLAGGDGRGTGAAAPMVQPGLRECPEILQYL